MHLCGHPVERIDGSTSSRDRQAAIDRYSKGACCWGGWRGLSVGHGAVGLAASSAACPAQPACRLPAGGPAGRPAHPPTHR